MTIKLLLPSIALYLLFFTGCSVDSTTIDTSSTVFHTKENSTNHIKLDISSIDSRLVYNDTLKFTSDSILVSLKIVTLKSNGGSVDIHLYHGHSMSHEGTTVASYAYLDDVSRTDTVKTNTLIYAPPDWITVTFRHFSGNVIFQMDNL
jgi:hypothetical protein